MWHSNRGYAQSSWVGAFENSDLPLQIETGIDGPSSVPVQSTPAREIGATAVGMVALMGLLVLMRRVVAGWKHRESARSQVAPPPPFPCRRCRYFNPSAFLYCAVHPTTAMTEAALDCPDFCDRQGLGTEQLIP